MKVSILSDLHIKNETCDAHKLLQCFFENKTVQASDTIVFLGDIFDLLIGNHEQYIEQYRCFFDGVKGLISRGVEVHYIEGNHDFHLSKLFNKAFKVDGDQKFFFHHIGFIKSVNGKDVYFGHGDELDLDNRSYRLYTKFIRSKFMQIFIDYIAGYRLLHFIGKRASKASRKKGIKRVSVNREDRRLKFHKYCEILLSNNQTLKNIFCGHTHFEDDVLIDGRCRYMNGGDARKTKKFIYVDEHGELFRDICEE